MFKNLLGRKLKSSTNWRSRFVIFVLIVLGIGWLWWSQVVSKPESVFFGMLDRSLQTTSVTRKVSQTDGESQLDQRTRLQLQPVSRANIITSIIQSGPAGTNKVITESIGTMQRDYTRYTSAETAQKKPDGSSLDFSSLLGVWAASDLSIKPKYLNESALGVIPIGSLSPIMRQELLRIARDKKVYTVDYAKVSGQRQLVFPVKLNTSAYAELLKAYGTMVGLPAIASLDTAAYKNAPEVELEIKVDVLSRQLLSINYLSGKRVENFSGWGLTSQTIVPTETITVAELTRRLQATLQ